MTNTQIALSTETRKPATDLETLRASLQAVRSAASVSPELLAHIAAALDAAERLAYAVPKARKAPAVTDGWIDYSANKRKLCWPAPVVAVTFADGESVRMSFASEAGKPWNVGAAVRLAIFAYRARIRRIMGAGVLDNLLSVDDTQRWISVPEITACHIEQMDEVVHAVALDVANARTADHRAGTFAMPGHGPVADRDPVFKAYKIAAARNAIAEAGDALDPRHLAHLQETIAREQAELDGIPAPIAAEPVAAAPEPEPVASDCLVWQAEKARRTARGSGAKWILTFAGREVGCAFKGAAGFRATASTAGKHLAVSGDTMADARAALERDLSGLSAELFGLSAIQFAEARA